MADPAVIEGDTVLYLVTKYRTLLAGRDESYAAGADTTNREPSPGEPFTVPLVIFTDNGGDSTSFLTGQADIGVSVLAGSKENPKPAMDLARLVRALRVELPGVGASIPVGSVVGATRPVLTTEEQPYARAYFLLTLGIVDSPL